MLGEEKAPFEGFAADLRHYGDLVQRAVQDKLGDLYPTIPQGEPVAWLWSRTIPCPNPMCRDDGAAVQLPDPEQAARPRGQPRAGGRGQGHPIRRAHGEGRSRSAGARSRCKGARARFECLACSQAVGEKELRAAGNDHTMGLQLMAVCIDEPHGGGRTFLAPDAVGDPVTEPIDSR